MDNKRGWTLVITGVGINLLAIILLIVTMVLAGEAGASGDAAAAGGALALIFAAYGLLFVALGFTIAWFATQNRDMNQITGGRFNTALWSVLLVVPIANIISLYKYAEHIQQAQTQRGVTGMNPVVLFLLMWLVGPVGMPIAQAQMSKLG